MTFQVESSEDQAALELRDLSRHFFVATLRSRGVSATARVGTYLSGGLADLFDFLAEHWTGWEGSKTWASLGGELRIDAHTDRLGHIYLTVESREGAPAKWTLKIDTILDAGVLPRLASAAREFECAVLTSA